MNKTTIFIIIGIIAAIGIVYYFSQSNSNNPPALAPKCCITYDALGNCTRYVWCSKTNAIATTSSPNGTIFTHINEIPVYINNTPAPAGAK